MNKNLLVPIIALFGLTIKNVFHIELSQADIDIIVDGVLSIITLYGIFMHPKKAGDNNGME